MQRNVLFCRQSRFRALYKDKKRAKELCEATSGKIYPENAEVLLCNLEDSLFIRYNDMGVAVDKQLLVLCEHQSTINGNIPYRLLEYVVFTYGMWFVNRMLLYGEELVKIPTPKFYMLYNGEKELEEDTLNLSSALAVEGGQLELIVHIIDINYERGHEVLEKCPSLKGYAYLISKIRENKRARATRDAAIANAVRTCITEGILSDFLHEKNYKEVCDMLNFEYNI